MSTYSMHTIEFSVVRRRSVLTHWKPTHSADEIPVVMARAGIPDSRR